MATEFDGPRGWSFSKQWNVVEHFPTGSMGRLYVYLPTNLDPIGINHSWNGKYTIVPWIRHGFVSLGIYPP